MPPSRLAWVEPTRTLSASTDSSTSLLALVVALDDPDAPLILAGRRAPGGAPTSFLGSSTSSCPRSEACPRAESLVARALTGGPPLTGIYATRLRGAECRFGGEAHVVALPSRTRPPRSPMLAAGCEWFPLGAFAGSDLYEPAAAACAALVDVLPRRMPPLAATGPAGSSAARDLALAAARQRSWAQGARAAEATDAALRAMIAVRAASLPATEGQSLTGWGDRVRTDRSSIPVALQGHSMRVPLGSLAALPFDSTSARFDPPHTNVPTPRRQRATSYRPRSVADILLPAALELVAGWRRREEADLRAYLSLGSAARRTNAPLAIGQDLFHPEARGIVWDLRSKVDGVYLPLDFSAPLESRTLMPDALEAAVGPDFPDRELLSFVRHGVRFKADVALQLVLLPHLTTLGAAASSVHKELLRLAARGWYSFWDDFPFLPCRLSPQGSTPRKLEPDRHRRTTDGGAPRRALVDTAGVPVIPLNVAVGLHDEVADAAAGWHDVPRPAAAAPSAAAERMIAAGLTPTLPRAPPRKWPREAKPTVGGKMHDNAILLDAAAVFGEPILTLTDDVADFFNHLGVATAELPNVCLLWLRPDGEGVAAGGHVVVSESRLGFGLSPSSNIAQRLSTTVVQIASRCFDDEELPRFEAMLADPLTPPAVRSWIEQRRALAVTTRRPQLRLFSGDCFTDDTNFSIVGVDRTVRFLSVWHRVTTSLGLLMAIPEKRQIGQSALWLGCDFVVCAGVLAVPPAKILRALVILDDLLASRPVPFSTFRALVGLLEHFRPLTPANRTFFYGLYTHFGELGRHPARPVPITATLRAACARWAKLLRSTAGVLFSNALPGPSTRRHLPAAAPPAFVLFSDAAKDGARVPSLGGYAHGLCWSLPLRASDLALPVVALEFVALFANVLIFAPRIAGAVIRLRTDSSVTDHILHNLSAHSPLLQHAHLALLDAPEWRAIAELADSEFLLSEMNPLADAASRGEFGVLERLCAQLGLRPTWLAVPVVRVQALLDELVALLSRPLVLAADPPMPLRGERVGEASNPGPVWRRSRVRGAPPAVGACR